MASNKKMLNFESFRTTLSYFFENSIFFIINKNQFEIPYFVENKIKTLSFSSIKITQQH